MDKRYYSDRRQGKDRLGRERDRARKFGDLITKSNRRKLSI